MSTRKNRRQDSSAIIQEFLSRNTTQKAFCQEKGVALSTLQFWLRRNRAQQLPNSESAFIPLEISSDRVDTDSYGCVIEYPNGVTLRLTRQVDIALLLQLITAKVI